MQRRSGGGNGRAAKAAASNLLHNRAVRAKARVKAMSPVRERDRVARPELNSNQPTPDADVDRLALVGVRKYVLDRGTPWWQAAYFRAVYLPFARLSHMFFNMPALGEVEVDKNGKRRYSWVEPTCIATDTEIAKAACRDEFYFITWLPVNSSLPRESVQYRAHVYPKSDKPLRHAVRTFPVAVPSAVLNREETIQQEAHEILDRMLARRSHGEPI